MTFQTPPRRPALVAAGLVVATSFAAEASVVSLSYGYDVEGVSPQIDFVQTPDVKISRSNPVVRVEQDETLPSTQPCCIKGSVRNVFQSKDEIIANDEFGSRVDIFVGDASPKTRTVRGDGQIFSLLEFNTVAASAFRISNTKMRAANNTIASVDFDVTIVEVPKTGTVSVDDIQFGNVLKALSYEAVLSAGPFSNPSPQLSITQSGFDFPLPEPGFVQVGNGYEWDFGVAEGLLDISSLGFSAGDRYGMMYSWSAEVETNGSGFAESYASFFDPLTGEGGFSLDTSDLTFLELGGDTAPAPVPLPAGFLLLMTGLASILMGKRCRS